MSETSANGQDTARQESAEGGGHRVPGMRLPEVHVPSVHVPTVHVPSMRMPSGTAGKVVWYGGLAAVAAFGVVDWPVAALVAAGTWVAEQHAKEAQRSSEKPAAAGERAA